ncbi:MAG TPA: PilN domain-containing protein [Candidatus Binatia bacterium]|nr:PilN domain-containing protein [Candidatus Binatia bacterium]
MSTIQLNLLPDIKLEYNKAQRTKRLVLSVAFLASAISLGIFIVMFLTVDVVQRAQMNSAGKSVNQASAKLTSVPQVNQIITVQNQLNSLIQLHQSKHISSRIYTYLSQLTPTNVVTINKLDLDLTLNTMTISGKANSQSDVNAFVDTLKAATYTVNPGDKPKPAFSSVVESAFSISSTGINYTINIQFDPVLFQNTYDEKGKPVTPTLTVTPTNASSLNPSSTLFNSSQSSGGN